MHSQNCISQTNAINFLLLLQYGEITSVGVQILFSFSFKQSSCVKSCFSRSQKKTLLSYIWEFITSCWISYQWVNKFPSPVTLSFPPTTRWVQRPRKEVVSCQAAARWPLCFLPAHPCNWPNRLARAMSSSSPLRPLPEQPRSNSLFWGKIAKIHLRGFHIPTYK
jgi:hypothetical protein